MKKCLICGIEKNTSEFHNGRNRCRECSTICTREWRKTESGKRHLKALRESEKYKNQGRIYHLKKRYGITLPDYERLLLEQKGVCAICGKADLYNRLLSVDHNHITNTVRGLLCNKCNRAYGLLDEDLQILEKMIAYHLKYNNIIPED